MTSPSMTPRHHAQDVFFDAVMPALPPEAQHAAAELRKVGLRDWVMSLASVASLGLIVWFGFWRPESGSVRQAAYLADAAISVLFALRLLARLARYGRTSRFWATGWWELIALVPLVTPWAGTAALPLVVIGLARTTRAIDTGDNVVGDAVTVFLIDHFSAPIVDAIKRPITVAVLDEVIDVIQTGTYAANVRDALDENRIELEQMVHDLLMADPTAGKLKYVPFHDEIVGLVSDTVLRIVEGALEDPRTTELISDVIRNSADQLRDAVRAKA
ncbi:ion transporter [Nocardioides jiangxiensis]|uniref:Ion transporter n=1 Tax=Nocardioides jiangxiensis TaxID=3064524 RepID=A0ABT9AYL5_9ACTN|nr:ion transporter [Nocardioides sp. WY-20]MDO7867165.1 ion transporter [Nocardioides sp. WY-20]